MAKKAPAQAEQVQAEQVQAKQVQAEQVQAEQVQAEQVQAKQSQAVSIVLIEANGTIKTLKTKEVSTDTLYKKCGFRVNDDFLCRHTWQVKLNKTETPYIISLWAKKTGKANFENKYDFPPPVDKELFFGTCAIVRTESETADTFLDLTKETWLKIYEHLFGGFEDLNEEDEFSEDELANIDPSLLTSHGYLKDDFVVSDKEAIESAETSEAAESETTSEADAESEAESEEAPVKPSKKGKAKNIMKKSAPKKSKKKPVVEEEEDIDTSELEEEVYTFSDDD
jgi:hypothetical protein